MNSGNPEFDSMRQRLRSAVPPWRETELRTDLWPGMLRRLEESPSQFGWLEALLVGSIALILALFPELIPAMLCQL